MATLILARHGRTTANATGVLAGRTKGVRLDEAGLEQARAAFAVRSNAIPANKHSAPVRRLTRGVILLLFTR